MKRNVRLVISYDGTRYLGWEHQPGTDMTIQGKIENVVSKMLDKETEVLGAGRTDAGVHAMGMVANFFAESELSEAEMKSYINGYLPDDICVESVAFAGERFHSRYNATGKTYRYTCYAGDSKPVFDRKYVYTLDKCPDIEKMREAAAVLKGEHDFASFCANPRMKKSTVRLVDEIKVEKNGPYIVLTFHGTGFLQHMVRILTGTLLEVGFGRMTPENVKEVMEAKDRKLAGPTAPASGLCLIKVDYS